MNAQIHDTPGLSDREVKRRHIVLKALIVGVVAGVLASAFRIALEKTEHWRDHLVAVAGGWGLPAALAVGAIGGGVGVWLVRRFAPHASGSGIPQLKSILLKEAEPEWQRLIPLKFLGGLFSTGGGLTLGREGPTVQMGSGIGHMVSEWFHVKIGDGERRALMSAGAGAGLGAAFNAPLSGLVFVLEELHGNFTPVMFVAAFLASVTGDIVARLLTDELPVFHLPGMTAPGMATLPWAAVLGVLAGGVGVLFNRCLLATLDLRDRVIKWPAFAVGAAAGLLVGLSGWLLPGLAGSGGPLVQLALSGRIALAMLPVFLVARFALTMVSYSTGAAGGIFAPLLGIGAMGGLLFGAGVHGLFVNNPDLTPGVFCVLGMGALFTAIVRAPLTGIVLMIELTGVYSFMLPLLVSCLMAYGVAEAMGNTPIYEALRLRSRPQAA
ncbi:H(+)/Cl(-) exchange transporter ClcA [Opitutus sp. GAS368]|uniref:H(+)/Cl(-) exchange transporter ClcA n=1 Tax=Opitutus sp. GAS368 TaxID=1882749 RepID=UPI00087AC3C3|nr:H(+)/Cl(-) exchange transporter ClcA [Opitutus sp. GAS368]SDS20035.1 chloride channel protein, CIC family [Opitutus sp. GAS368]